MSAHSSAFLAPHATRIERALRSRLDDCRSESLADTLRSAAELGPSEPAALALATAEHVPDSQPGSALPDGSTAVDFGDDLMESAVAIGLIDLAARIHAALAEAPGAPDAPIDDEFDAGIPPAILAGDVGFALGFGSIESVDDPESGVERFATLAKTMADVTAGVCQATEWDGESLADIEAALARGAGSLYATALVVGIGNVADEGERVAVRQAGRHLAVAVALRRCESLRAELARASLLNAADRRADRRSAAAHAALGRVDTSLQNSLETVLDGMLDGTVP
ncbi:hypothetical protein JCM17823_00970 [Halorubrum gandharaense]